MLNGLHTEDLFLTCACVLGTASALDRLDKEFLTKIPRYVAKLDPSPAFADDVSQTLLERLLCAPAGEEPVLVTFSGHVSYTHLDVYKRQSQQSQHADG